MDLNLNWYKSAENAWKTNYKNMELTIVKQAFPCKNKEIIFAYTLFFSIDTGYSTEINDKDSVILGDRYLETEIGLSNKNLNDAKREVKEILIKLTKAFKEN